MKKILNLEVTLLFCVFLTGLFLIFFSVLHYVKVSSFNKSAILTDGQIISLKENVKKATIAPVYSYTDHNNLPQKGQGYITSRKDKYKVGQKVKVLFSPEMPNESALYTQRNNYMPSIMAAFLGIVIIAITSTIYTKRN